MARIFISYARKDGSDIAEELADRLRAFDHEVFLDVHSIRAGTRWRYELQRRIAWADLMVVLVTPSSNESEYVRGEIALAEKINRPILPIQINNTRTPDHLRSEWQILKLEGDNFDRVLLEMEHALRLLPSRPLIPSRPLAGIILLIMIIGTSFFLFSYRPPSPENISTPISTAASGSVATAVMNRTPIVNEDFEDQTADNWILQWGSNFNVIDDGTGNYVWSSTADGEVFYEPSAEWNNYAIALDYYILNWDDQDGTGVVVALRRQADHDCSRYDFILHPDQLVLGAADDNCVDFNFFAEDNDHPNTTGIWHTLYAGVNRTQLQWWLDGDEMQTYDDERYTVGSLGILNLRDTEIWFDNLRLWRFE
jgi:hypothetical protein